MALILSPFVIAHLLEAPTCPSAALGIPCPGCGLTRATLALLSGDLAAAHHFHPLVLVLLPVYGGGVLWALLAYVADLPLISIPRRAQLPLTVFGTALIVASFAVWLLRFWGWFGGPVPVETATAWSRRTLQRYGVAAVPAPSTAPNAR